MFFRYFLSLLVTITLLLGFAYPSVAQEQRRFHYEPPEARVNFTKNQGFRGHHGSRGHGQVIAGVGQCKEAKVLGFIQLRPCISIGLVGNNRSRWRNNREGHYVVRSVGGGYRAGIASNRGINRRVRRW